MDILSLQTFFLLFISALVLLLPGTAIYLLARQLFDKERSYSPATALLTGAGLSIAFWPLLLLYTSLVGLSFSPLFLWAALLVCGLYVAYHIAARPGLIMPSRDALWAGVALAGMTALALIFRLGDIQGLDVPMFGDSLHHTLVTTIILNTGRLPTGYLPYVPVDTFTYHFGFHTLAAVLGQLGGVGAPMAVLLMGQVLNALTVPVAYLLNRQLFGSRLAGLGAALITGFVSIMPAFYVNWGRYTQLSGHILVVVALVLIVRTMTAGWQRSDLAMSALCVAGLMVVHYRVLIFFGLFGVALGAWQLASRWGHWRELLSGWGRGLAAVIFGLAATFTWLLNVASNYFPILSGRLKTVTPDYLAQYDNPDTIRVYVGAVVLALALLGVALAVVRRLRPRGYKSDEAAVPGRLSPIGAVVTLVVWSALLIASLWPVPGAIGSYTVAISFYIPMSALGGYGLGLMAKWLQTFRWGGFSIRRGGFQTRPYSEALPALGLLLLAPLAAIAMHTWHIADLNYAYVHEADEKAFAWIAANTPPDAKFLISSEFSYAGRGLTATDAGMWLPLLAHRNVSVPALPTWVEHPIDPSFFTDTRRLAAYTQPVGKPGEVSDSLQINLMSRGVITHTANLSSEDALKLMQKLGVSYVYAGAKAGSSASRLDIEAMRHDTRHYVLRYFEDGVYVFEVKP